MATSLIRGKYVVSRAGWDADSSGVIGDGAVFQRDGVIEEVGPSTSAPGTRQARRSAGPGTLSCRAW